MTSMRKIRGFSILLYTLSVFPSSGQNRNVTGTYRTNFPVLKNVSTTIKLNPDSTFEYVSQGDLLYDSSSGNYRVLDHKVFLYAIWKKTGPYRYTRMETEVKIFRSGRDSVRYQAFLYAQNDKLFFANFETGKKIRKAKTDHKRKEYLLFGSHYFNKKWYLEKIN